jgi:hypothetical protein
MNENFDRESYNAELVEDGFIRLLRDCNNEELFTKYGPKYSWVSLKTKALQNLVDEVEKRFPTMKNRISRIWTTILESNCSLEMWVRKLIEGRCINNELHGIKFNEQGKQDVGMVEVKQMVLFLTYGPTHNKFNFRNLNRELVEVTECGASRTRYGREMKASLTKFTKFDGANVILGDPAMIMDCDKGNARILELMDKIRKGIETTRKSPISPKDPIVKVGKGRIRVELKINDKPNNKSRMRIKACRNMDELRSALMEEKVWKVTLREHMDEDKVPGRGWCGYLSVDQVRRNADTVQELGLLSYLKRWMR